MVPGFRIKYKNEENGFRKKARSGEGSEREDARNLDERTVQRKTTQARDRLIQCQQTNSLDSSSWYVPDLQLESTATIAGTPAH